MSYKGGAQSTTKHLRYAPNFYNSHAILEAEVITEAEARAEYSRLRSIARKRLERFEGTEWTDTNVYKYNKGRFKPISEVKNYAELASLLGDVARFLTNDAHPNSVSELSRRRDQAIATLHENNYKFVNKANFKAFGEFMEEVRSMHMHVKGSPETELFVLAKKKQIPPKQLLDDFTFWMQNREALQKTPRIKNDKPHGADDYKKIILAKKEKQAQKNARKK